MTNIEKVKRILDAGHWVKVTYEDGVTRIITSYYKDLLSYVRTDADIMFVLSTPDFKDCTIEVIQRIPTAYKDWDKVLVLSNPDHYSDAKQEMVWKVLEIWLWNGINYVVSIDGKLWYHFPSYCLSPVFEEEISNHDLILSGKEAKIVIDGKEYSVTLKLI